MVDICISAIVLIGPSGAEVFRGGSSVITEYKIIFDHINVAKP